MKANPFNRVGASERPISTTGDRGVRLGTAIVFGFFVHGCVNEGVILGRQPLCHIGNRARVSLHSRARVFRMVRLNKAFRALPCAPRLGCSFLRVGQLKPRNHE